MMTNIIAIVLFLLFSTSLGLFLVALYHAAHALKKRCLDVGTATQYVYAAIFLFVLGIALYVVVVCCSSI